MALKKKSAQREGGTTVESAPTTDGEEGPHAKRRKIVKDDNKADAKSANTVPPKLSPKLARSSESRRIPESKSKREKKQASETSSIRKAKKDGPAIKS